MVHTAVKPVIAKEMTGLGGFDFFDLIGKAHPYNEKRFEVDDQMCAAFYRILNREVKYDEAQKDFYLAEGRKLFDKTQFKDCKVSIRRVDKQVLLAEVSCPDCMPRGSMYLYVEEKGGVEFVSWVDPLGVTVYAPSAEWAPSMASLPFWKHPFEKLPVSTIAPAVIETCKKDITTPCHEKFMEFCNQVQPELKRNFHDAFEAFALYIGAMDKLGTLLYEISYVQNAMLAERKFQPSSEVRVTVIRNKRIVASFVGRTRSLLGPDEGEQ